jgi:Uma2 family endonuclease
LTTADLVVEILSPGSAMYDRTAKADTYAALGVAELWLVDLESRSIEQRVLRDGAWEQIGIHSGDAPMTAQTFSGLAVTPAALFV